MKTGGGFAVHAASERGGWRLGLVGELDLATVDLLAREVRCLASADARPVLVDLRHLEFADVAGVRALLDACAVLAEHSRDVTMTQAPEGVERVLELMCAPPRLPLAD
jgi:anti-anti-sigma factor